MNYMLSRERDEGESTCIWRLLRLDGHWHLRFRHSLVLDLLLLDCGIYDRTRSSLNCKF